MEVQDALDWRDFGAVNNVKDQKSCGSCYAFSTIDALESQLFIKTGKSLSFSQQEIIDCSYNNGCKGGSIAFAFNYIIDHGISFSSDYSTTTKQGVCRPKTVHRNDVFGYAYFEDETNLKKALTQFGPIVVELNINQRSFKFYKEGIYNDAKCKGAEADHAGVIVGYGTDNELGMDYWIFKNSWSKYWGEDGYMRIAMNNNSFETFYYPLFNESAKEQSTVLYNRITSAIVLSIILFIIGFSCWRCSCCCPHLCKKSFCSCITEKRQRHKKLYWALTLASIVLVQGLIRTYFRDIYNFFFKNATFDF
jgi:Papain family cysteine protease